MYLRFERDPRIFSGGNQFSSSGRLTASASNRRVRFARRGGDDPWIARPHELIRPGCRGAALPGAPGPVLGCDPMIMDGFGTVRHDRSHVSGAPSRLTAGSRRSFPEEIIDLILQLKLPPWSAPPSGG